MQVITRYNIIFAIVPIVLIVIIAWYLNVIPNTNAINKFINNTLNIFVEKDMKELMLHNGFPKTSVESFQRLRLALSILVAVAAVVFLDEKLWVKLGLALIVTTIFFKLIYIYLLYLDAVRIKKMNRLLPYAMKTISYLMYEYPVATAIEKAIPSVPKEYKHDMELMLQDLMDNPNTSDAFDNMIERYHGRLDNLDNYFRLINRLQISGTRNASETLTNLNKMISEGVNISRQQTYRAQNKSISYLGLLPVVILCIMLLYLLLCYVDAVLG